jgi:putative spermidine/putrescine transport system permease protein
MSGSGNPPFGPLGVMRTWLQGRRSGGERRRQRGSLVWWFVFLLGVLYFVLPLIGTLEFSLRTRPVGRAYENVLNDPKFYSTLIYSFGVAIVTILLSIAIVVPTAYWVRLKMPRLRPIIEFVTLVPFVVPPVVLVFGLIRIYSAKPFVITATELGSTGLLVGAYVVLSFPYMYRAVDTGLSTMDVRTLTEAAQSLGSGWLRIIWRVILPNLRGALLAGAFLTLAIVIGEYTIANFLARPAFGPYLSLIGRSKPFEPAALSLISFAITWLAMGVIAFVGRGARDRVQVAGAR